ncbi:DNA topology modulation protein [Legionella beliardensis]|uniref:DNA topology modulation protein n=1 Tax=Legionella beliardensis TaxID=91822 RepID=A0A378I3E2_9GAMM|nr:DNA topology modulation protein [Legionella beliardensis]STX29206.1 DNA topology modulation protein [Legionella beliardensis]
MAHRIMIMGRSGSGKSTFAYHLHQQTKLPLYHLDKYFFTDYWVERDYQEFLTIQQALVNQEQWIIDGNSTKSFELRYQRASVCIYFNYPRYRCYWRVFKRLFFKDKRIDDRANNCPEKVSWSLIKYMWGFERRVEVILHQLKRSYPQTQFIEIRSDKLLKLFSQNFLTDL